MSLQTEAEAVVSAARRIIRMRGGPEASGERWITIGGRKGEEGEHVGGFPCKINADGEIIAGGPKGLRGKKVSEIYRHFKRMRNTPAAKEKRYQTIVKKQAKAWKISPEEYQQFADEVHKEKMAHHTARESAKAAARKTMGISAGDVRRWEEQGLDYSSPKLSKHQWDVQGQRLASQFPDLGWGEGYSEGVHEGGHDAKLWALLKEGKVDPPSRHSEEFHADVDEYLQYLASQTPGGLDDAPDAEDTSFDFGALAEDDATRFGLDVPKEGDRKPAADGGMLTFHQGRWHRGGVGFASPNKEDRTLTLQEAFQNVGSERHQAIRRQFEEIDKSAGVEVKHTDIIGDWGTGAENSVLSEYTQYRDFDELRYLMAWKGKVAEQKATLVFEEREGGTHHIYTMFLPTTVEQARTDLQNANVFERSFLVASRGGTIVVVVDREGKFDTGTSEVARKHDVERKDTPGYSEQIGVETDQPRESAYPIYDRIIREYEQRFPERSHFRPAQRLAGSGASSVSRREANRPIVIIGIGRRPGGHADA